ncbi:MAG: cation:proton antiporter [Planctomycetes bacterium]|nr:cation:proton antiporter [Planctomycetota bacterium]MCU0728083.1 cation:proton antiporter [Planctomycetota bacterium]
MDPEVSGTEPGDRPAVRLVRRGAGLAALLAAPLLLASGGGEGATAPGSLSIIAGIAACMVAASAAGILMRLLRQPAILGYILAGVAVGPLGLRVLEDAAEIETISEIGLILLLFMIGLEIDLRRMFSAGRLVLVPGILQFPLCAAAGWALLAGLSAAGLSFGSGAWAVPYVAAAIAMSSTMIVVKLLYDKRELDTLPGRITVGILVFQDLWAIVLLAVQPNLADPRLLPVLWTFGKGALLVGAAFLASRYALPVVFRMLAKVPELLLVLSLGWCFLAGLAAKAAGLSMEMGALIAGVSLATFPYNLDVIARVVSIRDFFITLFFVALGLQIPRPEPAALVAAAAVVAAVFATRAVGVFGLLEALRAGHRVSLLPALNLSQVSEFSLVIVALGVKLGHVGPETLACTLWAFSILAVASTYLVAWNHGIQSAATRILSAAGFRDAAGLAPDEARAADRRPVVLLGFFRTASAFLDEATRKRQGLLPLVKVVDFNPECVRDLEARGIPCVYGDVALRSTLEHAGLADAKVLVCTLSDSILRGSTNKKVLQLMREISPGAQRIVTAESPGQAMELYEAGADFVLQPSAVSGSAAAVAVEQALSGTLAGMRAEAIADLAERREVLSRTSSQRILRSK